MIENTVFDMGNVLVDHIADGVCRHFIEDQETGKEVSTSIFVSPEWILLDLGTMPEDMALKEMQTRLDTEEERSLVTLCFNRRHEFNMHKKEGMEDAVRWLKSTGYGIYLCPNAFVRLLSCCKDVLSAVDCSDGILFSVNVLYLKPQEEMYDHFFERFHPKPEEYLSVDDLELNIEGMRHCGIDGYCFDDGDMEKLKEILTGSNRR